MFLYDLYMFLYGFYIFLYVFAMNLYIVAMILYIFAMILYIFAMIFLSRGCHSSNLSAAPGHSSHRPGRRRDAPVRGSQAVLNLQRPIFPR